MERIKWRKVAIKILAESEEKNEAEQGVQKEGRLGVGNMSKVLSK